MTLGERIKRCRIAAGWSQEEFAKLIHCSIPTLNFYEINCRTPNLKKLMIISNALGMPCEILLEDVDK